MFHRWNWVAILTVVVLAPAAMAQQQMPRQEKAKPALLPGGPMPGGPILVVAPGPAESVLAAWNYVGDKLITMARDFPADKYDYKPTPEVRSFAEIMLHVAAVDKFVSDVAAGRKTGSEDMPRARYNTKEKVVQAITEAVHEGAATIRKEGDHGMMRTVKSPFGGRPISLLAFTYSIVEHSGEHYGNLVTYYRLNHLVPPASRPRPKR